MNLLAQGFVDGAFLRARALEFGSALVQPRLLVENVIGQTSVQTLCFAPNDYHKVRLARTRYYDGWPEGEEQPDLLPYWEAIELLPDTHLGFGSVVGRPRRQKAVDSLIAVDLLTGAFDRLFQVAVLVAGDGDYVPVVEEVRRRGIWVVVAAVETKLADSLRRAADRVVPIGPGTPGGWYTQFASGEFRQAQT